MKIRAYTSKDYAPLLRVYRESFGPEFTERLLKDHLYTSDACWVALADQGDVVGYLIAESLQGTSPYLSQVAVDPQSRGTGIASKLIKVFEEHYAAHASVWLQVKVENPSQKLYFDLGYRVSNFEPHLYGPQKHGLRMEKQLAAEIVA